MKKLTKYEIKKVFSKVNCKVALAILAIVVAAVSYFACDVSFVNEQGETITGREAVSGLRDMQKEWAGILDEEKIAKAIALNHEITSSPEYNSKDLKQREMAYHEGQAIQEIRNLLNDSFAKGFQDYDYYLADSLTETDAPNFYRNRLNLLKDWLDTEANTRFSEKEKEYLIGQYEEAEIPFYYDYVKGWQQLFENSMPLIMIIMLVLGFLTAGIFSNEFTWKADSIFFVTVKGRNQAVAAKLKAGFIIVTSIYFIAIVSYTIIVLGYLGADGMNCPVQVIQWESMYNVEMWQEYLLIVLGGYLGTLFITAFCMLISASTKSSVVAVIIPFVMLFLSIFIENISDGTLRKILVLLPDQLLQVYMVSRDFYLYQIGGTIFSALAILFIGYSILTVVLYPVTYRVYKKRQIE